MSTNRSMVRRAGSLAALALLALVLGAVAPTSPGSALGAVIAITPNEVVSDGFVGVVEDPSLSGRGEVAGIYDGEVRENSFVFLDAAGREPMLDGLGIAVSGNGCVAMWARPSGSTLPGETVSIGITDRCRGIEREVVRTNENYESGSAMALSYTGRFGVYVQGFTPGEEFDASDVVRVDTQSGAIAFMPIAGFPYGPEYGWDPHLGVDISDDGSVVVAVEKGFQFGQFLRDIVAWDVPSNTTQFLSGTPGLGSPLEQSKASGFPSISGNGRFVSFTSTKVLAGRPPSSSGPWTYVANRSNGQIRMISAVADSTYHTSITRDGSQLAYTVGPPNCQFNPQTLEGIESTCQGLRVDVAFGPTPGFTSPFSSETISILANGGQGGMHMMPALSGNGQWVAWISDAGNALLGTPDPELGLQHAFTRRRDVGLTVDPLDFGTIAAGTTSTLPTTIRNTGRTSISLDSITVAPARFTVQGGGTCVGGRFLPPGATCTVNVRFTAPNDTSETPGEITISEVGFSAVSAANPLIGRSSLAPIDTPSPTVGPTVGPTIGPTIGPTTPPSVVGQPPTPTVTGTNAPGQIALTADPNPVDFGQVAVGIGSPIRTVTITNISTAPGQLLTELGGTNPDDFFVARNGCNEVTLAPTESCTMDIMMIPLAGGLREASLILSAGGASGDVGMFGTGHFAPQLIATPEAITTDGFTTIIGRGFPPNQTFDVHLDPTARVLTATSDAQGQFRIPVSAVGRLSLGNYVLRIDPVPNVFDLVRGQLVVVLPTFQPQSAGAAVLGEALLVTRGS